MNYDATLKFGPKAGAQKQACLNISLEFHVCVSLVFLPGSTTTRTNALSMGSMRRASGVLESRTEAALTDIASR